MEAVEKLSITLPARLARMVRAKVEEGAYASNSEVIRETLRVWQEREAARERRLAEIRQEIADAINDPRPSVPAKQVFDEIQELHRKTVKARQHGA